MTNRLEKEIQTLRRQLDAKDRLLERLGKDNNAQCDAIYELEQIIIADIEGLTDGEVSALDAIASGQAQLVTSMVCASLYGFSLIEHGQPAGSWKLTTKGDVILKYRARRKKVA